MDRKFTLYQLNQLIKDSLTDAIPGNLWVVGEISEMTENRSGHCYLELIEKEGNKIIARARAVIWSYTYRMIKPYFETTTGRPFKEGIKILVMVAVEFHHIYGLSLVIKDIEPAYTIGDMALQRKEIIDRLKAENIFYMNKELELPLVPQRIAVISSKTAAGYQDFMDHLENNPGGFKFYPKLFEAYMQGAEAVDSIINALDIIFKFEKDFDAVAIIRGGGATADLDCFDNYDLAFHVTQFPLPVITGIGHEKDDTIIDLVAHTRLKTPTAVAEFFISGAERFYELLTELKNNLVNMATQAVELKQAGLKDYSFALEKLTDEFIAGKKQCLMKTGNRLTQTVGRFSFRQEHKLINIKHDLNYAISGWSADNLSKILRSGRILNRLIREIHNKHYNELNLLTGKVKYFSGRYLTRQQERLNMNAKTLHLLDPDNILRRGYSISLSNSKLVKSIKQLNIDDELETLFPDGRSRSIIIKKEYNGNSEN